MKLVQAHIPVAWPFDTIGVNVSNNNGFLSRPVLLIIFAASITLTALFAYCWEKGYFNKGRAENPNRV